MADDGDAPGSAQEPLPRQPAHVGHVRVVDGEAEHPGSNHNTRQADRQEVNMTRQTGGAFKSPVTEGSESFVVLEMKVSSFYEFDRKCKFKCFWCKIFK